MDFFDRLYLGFEAEYYVMGLLYGAGLEAFKLPADFGFDLMVTNQKELSVSKNQKQRENKPPYALQIKSRRLIAKDFYNGPNGRQSADITFSLSAKELNLLLETSNSYLVCVLFLATEANSLHKRTFSFWLESSHVKALLSRGYIQLDENMPEKKDGYFIKTNIRLMPMQKVDKILENLVSKGNLTKEGEQILAKCLPAEVPVKDNAHEYISLKRPAKSEGYNEVTRAIPSGLSKLSNLGEKISISNLD